jgi:hypothetical protein
MNEQTTRKRMMNIKTQDTSRPMTRMTMAVNDKMCKSAVLDESPLSMIFVSSSPHFACICFNESAKIN